MYTQEQKERAIELYIQSDRNCKAVIASLGYPSKGILRRWYREYQKNGCSIQPPKRKYSEKLKESVIQQYLRNGKDIKKTVKETHIPRSTLADWLKERKIVKEPSCVSESDVVKYSIEHKAMAVTESMCTSEPDFRIASKYEISETTLQNWKKGTLNFEAIKGMRSKAETKPANMSKIELDSATSDALKNEIKRLQKENAEQKRQLYQVSMEHDILSVTIELLKKDKGINPKLLSNREKAQVIGALNEKYELKNLLKELKLPRSSYYYAIHANQRGDKYTDLRKKIAESFELSKKTYGYRRIRMSIHHDIGTVSEKVIRRIMKEEHLKVINISMKKYSSYAGEISPEVPNLIQRNFHADAPNQILLTDITEFSIPSGKVYLSPAIDCFDGMPVAWTIGTSPNASLVNTMLDAVIEQLKADEHPIIHSDRGCHYRWPGWIERMEQAGLTRSMSKKGCCADNSACEGFFGHLKTEMFYGRDWSNTSVEQFIEELNGYIVWYREKRIKETIGYISPLEYRSRLSAVG